MNLLKQLPYWHFKSQTFNGDQISAHRRPYFKRIRSEVQQLVNNLQIDLDLIVEDLELDEEWQNDLDYFSINVSRELDGAGGERLKISFSWTAREIKRFTPAIYLISNLDGKNVEAVGAIGKPVQIARFVELITRTLAS